MDVIIVGAGPTGLLLACELALAGIRCQVLERRRDQPNITRAFAVHARTLELLDARSLADDLVPRGLPVRQIAPAPDARVDLRGLPSRYPMVLIVPQSGTEKLLEARARDLGVEISYGVEVSGVEQDGDGVTVASTAGRHRTGFAVGCDGAHSAVRRLVGVDFVGAQYQTHIMLADVRLSEPPQDALFARTNENGAVIVVPFGDGWFRAIAWDLTRATVPLEEPLSIAEVRDAFGRIAGSDFGMGQARWSSRFLSERRQAARYRVGRVFLAGDAAHVHSPLGGQGMNTGLQDAMNLGWKLAAAVRGWAAPWLLDSYHKERHPVGARVLALTDALNQVVLGGSRFRAALRRTLIRTLVRVPPARTALVGRLTGIGIAYPRRSRHDHPWTGRRMVDVSCADGRLYELLRTGRFVLVTPRDGGPADRPVDAAGTDRVRTSGSDDPRMPAPAVLVRPDGYVAWAGPLSGTAAALRAWCGPHGGTPPGAENPQ